MPGYLYLFYLQTRCYHAIGCNLGTAYVIALIFRRCAALILYKSVNLENALGLRNP